MEGEMRREGPLFFWPWWSCFYGIWFALPVIQAEGARIVNSHKHVNLCLQRRDKAGLLEFDSSSGWRSRAAKLPILEHPTPPDASASWLRCSHSCYSLPYLLWPPNYDEPSILSCSNPWPRAHSKNLHIFSSNVLGRPSRWSSLKVSIRTESLVANEAAPPPR